MGEEGGGREMNECASCWAGGTWRKHMEQGSEAWWTGLDKGWRLLTLFTVSHPQDPGRGCCLTKVKSGPSKINFASPPVVIWGALPPYLFCWGIPLIPASKYRSGREPGSIAWLAKVVCDPKNFVCLPGLVTEQRPGTDFSWSDYFSSNHDS